MPHISIKVDDSVFKRKMSNLDRAIPELIEQIKSEFTKIESQLVESMYNEINERLEK